MAEVRRDAHGQPEAGRGATRGSGSIRRWRLRGGGDVREALAGPRSAGDFVRRILSGAVRGVRHPAFRPVGPARARGPGLQRGISAVKPGKFGALCGWQICADGVSHRRPCMACGRGFPLSGPVSIVAGMRKRGDGGRRKGSGAVVAPARNRRRGPFTRADTRVYLPPAPPREGEMRMVEISGTSPFLQRGRALTSRSEPCRWRSATSTSEAVGESGRRALESERSIYWTPSRRSRRFPAACSGRASRMPARKQGPGPDGAHGRVGAQPHRRHGSRTGVQGRPDQPS